MSQNFLQSHRRSFAVGLVFLGISAAGWFMLEQSRRDFSSFVMPGDLGPFFLAELCLSAIALTGLAMLAQGGFRYVRTRQAGVSLSRAAGDYRRWLVPVLFMASMTLLPMTMRAVGTIPALGGFSVLWIFVLCQQSAVPLRRSVAMALGGGIGVGVFVHIVFVRLLNLPLPG